MYLISSNKKGVSSHQISRDINVTQKTAWFILHKIRSMYAQSDASELSGIVECDEMYLGGAEKNKHESKRTWRHSGPLYENEETYLRYDSTQRQLGCYDSERH